MPFGVFQKGIVKREPLDVKQLFWSVLQDVLKFALMNINKSSGICFFFFFFSAMLLTGETRKHIFSNHYYLKM